MQEGKVKHLGVSNFNLAQMQQSVELSATPILTNQVHYSLLHREPAENGVLDYCQEQGILLTAYSPVKGGVLDLPLVAEIAQQHGVTAAKVALRWLIDQPMVITIPKTSKLSHAQDNLAALDLMLSADDTKRLNALKPKPA